jgi:ATP-dependent DNA helicase PIF1
MSRAARFFVKGSSARPLAEHKRVSNTPKERSHLLAGTSLRGASMGAVDASKHQELIDFGKHLGLTYSDVAANYPEYGAWVLKSARRNHAQGLNAFASYLQASTPQVSQASLALPQDGLSIPAVAAATPVKTALKRDSQKASLGLLQDEMSILAAGAAATKPVKRGVKCDSQEKAAQKISSGKKVAPQQVVILNAEQKQQQDQRILTFGKHIGLTFSEVATNHAEYGAWALEEAAKPGDKLANLCDFASYFEASAGQTQYEQFYAVQAGPIKADRLTPEQEQVAKKVLSGQNAVITGAGGTGKSFLLRYLIQELELLHPGRVAVTGMTGIAAANIGGQTLHSFAGIGLAWGGVQRLVKQINNQSHATQRWQQAKVLVVDEVSMCDGSLFTKLEEIAQRIRHSREPFGGLQLLLCGDFLQLPPVREATNEYAQDGEKFCFQTAAWDRCALTQNTLLLETAVRAAADPTFVDILSEVRLGKVSEKSRKALEACRTSVKPVPTDGICPTKLYCLNKDVDKENKSQLDSLPGEAVVLEAEDTWTGDPPEKNVQVNLGDTLNKRVPKKLHLKVGAQVILIKNYPEWGLVNGSRGIVVAFRFKSPLVRFDNGKLIRISKQQFIVRGSDGIELKRSQVPLKLGWALTVHKAAGLTLSRAVIKVDAAFEAGQAYVALSRLTGIDGLWISGGINPSRTRADPDALKFYMDHASTRSVRSP